MDFGKALQGIGMGMSGQGAQWAKLQQNEQLMRQQQQEQELARRQAQQREIQKAMAIDGRVGLYHLERGNEPAFEQLLTNRIELIKQQGRNPSDSMALMDKWRSGDKKGVMQDLQAMEFKAVEEGLLEKREAPETQQMQVQSSEILSDGTVITVLKSGTTQVIDSQGKELTGQDRAKAIRKAREFGAITQGDRATQREIGKLQAQFKLSPKVKSAVEEAVLAARDKSAVSTDDRSNERAFEVYQAATNGLIRSFEDTATGPFAGFLPAITSSQQIADGAVAAMAPTLKQLFRSAGEGTFTDSDQRILMQMIPTRSDRPDSVRAKLANIDTIVKAKLGISERQEPQPAAPVVQSPPTPQKNMKWSELE